MKKAVVLWSALGAAAVIVFSGCSFFSTYKAYSGPKLSENELGTLYFASADIYVNEVDGKELSRGDLDPDKTKRIYFQPGRHTIKVS